VSTNVSGIHHARRHARDRREEALLWRRTVGGIVTLALAILVWPLAAAPPAGKVYRIGFLRAGQPPQPMTRKLEDNEVAVRYNPEASTLLESLR